MLFTPPMRCKRACSLPRKYHTNDRQWVNKQDLGILHGQTLIHRTLRSQTQVGPDVCLEREGSWSCREAKGSWHTQQEGDSDLYHQRRGIQATSKSLKPTLKGHLAGLGPPVLARFLLEAEHCFLREDRDPETSD